MIARRLLLTALAAFLLAAPAALAQPFADFGVTKSVPATTSQGANVTYTITVTNDGPDDAADSTLTDQKPAGTTFFGFQQTSGPAYSCTLPNPLDPQDPGIVTCTSGPFPAGAVATFQFTVTIPANGTPGTFYTNVANITSSTADPNEENNSGSAATMIPAPNADVSVLKSAPSTVPPGADVPFTITVTNLGPSTATNVSLTDILPGTMTYVSIQQSGPAFNCTTPAVGSNGTINCTNASLAPNTPTTFTITANVPLGTSGGTQFLNTAQVMSSYDPNSGNDSSDATVTVGTADLAVVKSGPATADAGTPMNYTITVSNIGPDVAESVTFTDALPAGTTFVSLANVSGPSGTCSAPSVGSSGTVSCTISAVASNGPSSYRLTVQTSPSLTVGSVITNTVTVSSPTFDPNTSNNQNSSPTTVTASADVAVTKNGMVSVTAGGAITYSVVVTNNGPSNAQNVTLTDNVPPGTTLASITPPAGWNCTANVCTTAVLVPNTPATFTVVVNTTSSTPNGTTLTNTATVSASTPDPVPANNSSTANTSTTTSADLAVTKTGPASALAGSNVSYTIGVTNNGPSDAATVTLTDATPANATFVSMTRNSGPTFVCTPGAGAVTCTIASLAAGATATFTAVFTAGPGATVANTATVGSATSDPNPANNSATATTPITPAANIGVTKNGPPVVTAGTNVVYTINVTNAGPSDAAGVTLSDPIPANSTFVSMTQTSGPTFTCTAGTANCTIATLTSGSTATFTLTVRAGGGPSITNTATVSSTTTDPTPANNTSSVTTNVTPVADLGVTKSGPAAAGPASNVTYTITVTNNGPSTATNVSLTDVVPANTTFVSMTQTAGPAFTCGGVAPGGTGTETCTIAGFPATATATFALVVQTSAIGNQTISNTAAVTSATADPNPANNQSTVSTVVATGLADLSITKTSDVPIVTPTTQATFTITVNNAGPATANAVTVTDVLAAGFAFVSATPSQGTCTGTTTVTCSLGALAPNANATVTLVVTGTTTYGATTNTATVSSPSPDPNPANNSSTVNLAVTNQIPTASEWGLILMGLALATLGAFFSRTR